MSTLTEKNFFHYAVSNLKSNYVSESEFKLLLKHLVYIKRLLKKYKNKDEDLNLNLLINHFIILFNEFEIEAAINILFFQLNENYHEELKSILILLDKIKGNEELDINYKTIHVKDITINVQLVNDLKLQLRL